MDENSVQYAIVVRHLDERDPMNNERALEQAKQFPHRLKFWLARQSAGMGRVRLPPNPLASQERRPPRWA